jgi:aldehyde:ferredoxin oxidoreductase
VSASYECNLDPQSAHMPQVKHGQALIYAINPLGAHHQSCEHDPSDGDYLQRMVDIGFADPQPNKILNQEKVNFILITQNA